MTGSRTPIAPIAKTSCRTVTTCGRAPWRTLLAGVVALTCATSCIVPASEPHDDTASFFAGRTMTYIVSTTAGGTYDTYARILTRYMSPHLDNVAIVVRNVPGAGHQVGLGQIYNAPPDGLTIGTFTMGMVYLQIAGRTAGRFDLGRLSWIGKAASEPRLLLIGTSTGFRSIDDVRHATGPVRISTDGAGTSAHFASHLVTTALDLPATMVHGFHEEEAQLAILRGELHALLASPSSVRALVQQNYARGLLLIGGTRQGFDDVPTLDEVDLPPDRRALFAPVEIQAELGRVTAGPPGIPPDRLERLRRAYMAAVRDPAFVAELDRLQLPVDPLDGAAVEERVARAVDAPPAVAAALRSALGE